MAMSDFFLSLSSSSWPQHCVWIRLTLIFDVVHTNWIGSDNPSFTEIVSSLDACLKLSTDEALQLLHCFLPAFWDCVTVKPWHSLILAIGVRAPLLECFVSDKSLLRRFSLRRFERYPLYLTNNTQFKLEQSNECVKHLQNNTSSITH